MGAAEIMALVIAFLTALPKLIAAGVDVISTIEKFNAKLKEIVEAERDPTPEEWDYLHSLMKVEEDKLNQQVS